MGADGPEDAQDNLPLEDEDRERLAYRDGKYVAGLIPLLRLVVKTWFRSEVTGMERLPEGGALMVSNHSGGLIAMDVPILAVAFHDEFGAERPLYVLAHDLLFLGSSGPVMRRAGFLPATRENAHAVLTSGGVTIVFPGGDYDVFRPSSRAHLIDFAGRKGYVRTALRAGVPIVPVVSIGGHEDQIHLFRGELLAKVFRLESLMRTKYLPVTFGFPFGLTLAFPPNLPLPTKIRTRVLDPIDIVEEFGPDPDIAEVDAAVRERMQTAMNELKRERRFPVIG
jgi:1-acyl-sn-glycerol-3-phosphate acyltransferase